MYYNEKATSFFTAQKSIVDLVYSIEQDYPIVKEISCSWFYGFIFFRNQIELDLNTLISGDVFLNYIKRSVTGGVVSLDLMTFIKELELDLAKREIEAPKNLAALVVGVYEEQLGGVEFLTDAGKQLYIEDAAVDSFSDDDYIDSIADEDYPMIQEAKMASL